MDHRGRLGVQALQTCADRDMSAVRCSGASVTRTSDSPGHAAAISSEPCSRRARPRASVGSYTSSPTPTPRAPRPRNSLFSRCSPGRCRPRRSRGIPRASGGPARHLPLDRSVYTRRHRGAASGDSAPRRRRRRTRRSPASSSAGSTAPPTRLSRRPPLARLPWSLQRVVRATGLPRACAPGTGRRAVLDSQELALSSGENPSSSSARWNLKRGTAAAIVCITYYLADANEMAGRAGPTLPAQGQEPQIRSAGRRQHPAITNTMRMIATGKFAKAQQRAPGDQALHRRRLRAGPGSRTPPRRHPPGITGNPKAKSELTLIITSTAACAATTGHPADGHRLPPRHEAARPASSNRRPRAGFVQPDAGQQRQAAHEDVERLRAGLHGPVHAGEVSAVGVNHTRYISAGRQADHAALNRQRRCEGGRGELTVHRREGAGRLSRGRQGHAFQAFNDAVV